MMSQGLPLKLSLEMASISSVKLKLDRFLKGMGGMRIWFFFAGILMTGVSSSGLQRSLMQTIWGTSHLAQMGRLTGCRLSSWTSRKPSMTQFSLTGGILTATLTWARSFLRILKRTSSKYSKRSLLLTEKTYSSRSLNQALLHLAITRNMKGFDPLSSIISSLSPMETSNSSMDPGKRVDFPNIMLVRLISTKYLVSVSSVASCSFSVLCYYYTEGEDCSLIFRSPISFSRVGVSSWTGAGSGEEYVRIDQGRGGLSQSKNLLLYRSYCDEIKNSQIQSNYLPVLFCWLLGYALEKTEKQKEEGIWMTGGESSCWDSVGLY